MLSELISHKIIEDVGPSVLATPAQVSRVGPGAGAGGAVSSRVSRLLVHHWIPKMSISIWVSCVSDLMDWQSGCGAGGKYRAQ